MQVLSSPSFSLESWTLFHRTVQTTLSVGLPPSVKPIQEMAYGHASEAFPLGGSRSCQVDSPPLLSQPLISERRGGKKSPLRAKVLTYRW